MISYGNKNSFSYNLASREEYRTGCILVVTLERLLFKSDIRFLIVYVSVMSSDIPHSQQKDISFYTSTTYSYGLLEEIAAFARDTTKDDTQWDTSSDTLAVSKLIIATLRDDNDQLIATATLSFPSHSVSWLGNVLVAKTHRRQGIASAITNATLQYAFQRCATNYVVLTAAVPELYHALSFKAISSVSIKLYEHKTSAMVSTEDIPQTATPAQIQKAVTLYSSITNSSKKYELERIIELGGKCVVLEDDNGEITAAVWGRKSAATNADPEGFFLAPVVAKSPDFAIKVCAQMMEIEKYQRSFTNSHLSPFKCKALVPQQKFNPSSNLVFEALGFEESWKLPYMAKSIHENIPLDETKLDVPSYLAGCYALLGYELG